MQETLEYIKQAFELKNQKCYKQAIEMLYKALETGNENAEIFFQLGELYFLLHNYSRASHYLEKVLSISENHIDTLKLMEKIYEFSGELSQAFSIAEKILSLENNQKNTIELIKIASQKGDIQKIKEFENSDDDKILYQIAKSFYDNKIINDSQSMLENIVKINPKNEDALVLLGKIYFDKSEFEKSRDIFNTFSKTSDNPEILNYLGLFALEDMKFIDAIKYFSKASSLDKKNGKYLYNLANAYFYNGWIKEALASYLQAVRSEPENLGYRYSLAYLYFETKNFDKAQKEIEYILSQDENYYVAHVLNALLKVENKDYLGAKIELETNSDKEDIFTLVSLAKVYEELLMWEKAEESIKKAIAKNPQSLNYKCRLAEIYCSQKKFDESLLLVDEIIGLNENYVPAYITGAKAAFESGDLQKAKSYAQNAISLDMNFAGGYFYLAMVRFEENDFDEAIECMKRAITYDVENARYYAKMSEIYEAKEDFKTAIEYLKEAESISGSTEYRIKFQQLAKKLK